MTIRGFFGWALGLLAVIGLYLPLYPSLNSPAMTDMINALPPELVKTLNYDQIASGAGYTEATFFKLTGFIIVTIAAVAWGTGAIAGKEESGELELILARATSRHSFALRAAGRIFSGLAGLSLIVFAAVAALNAPSELDLSMGHLAGTVAAWGMLACVAGAASASAGAATGRKTWAIGAGAGLAMAGYVFNALAGMRESLDWLRFLSPFYWAFGNQPLSNGPEPVGLVGLGVLAVVLVGFGAFALSRRDIS